MARDMNKSARDLVANFVGCSQSQEIIELERRLSRQMQEFHLELRRIVQDEVQREVDVRLKVALARHAREAAEDAERLRRHPTSMGPRSFQHVPPPPRPALLEDDAPASYMECIDEQASAVRPFSGGVPTNVDACEKGAYDGEWVDSVGLVATIEGRVLHWPSTGKRVCLTRSTDRFCMLDAGKEYTAILTDGLLVWNDGESWARATPMALAEEVASERISLPPKYEGGWRNAAGESCVIEKGGIKWTSGVVCPITPSPEGSSFCIIYQEQVIASLVNDRLEWSDGDVWERGCAAAA